VIKNKGVTPAEYRLNTVRTEPAGSGTMAAAMTASTHAGHAAQLGDFDPTGSIAYSVASGGHVLIRVFTVHGRLVRTITDQAPGPGRHVTRWDGRTEDGSKLAKGVYLYRIRHPNGDQSTVKTVLLR
jgi:flagellar hook assembly protein FlgD